MQRHSSSFQLIKVLNPPNGFFEKLMRLKNVIQDEVKTKQSAHKGFQSVRSYYLVEIYLITKKLLIKVTTQGRETKKKSFDLLTKSDSTSDLCIEIRISQGGLGESLKLYL